MRGKASQIRANAALVEKPLQLARTSVGEMSENRRRLEQMY